jgi:PAS domain S-box-containing protein
MADGIRVLYVDDEPGLLEIAQQFLEESGEFKVGTSVSAQDALDSPLILSYDAIVSDYQMPGMDGIAFLKEVRKRFGDLPFILFTGRGREEVVIEAINNGVDSYLQKGGDPEAQFVELAHKIRQAVLMRRTQMTLAEQEQRYHDLQNASDLIQSIAPDGHFLFANKKWLDTLGYKEEELSDLTLADIVHEESLQHCMTTFQRVISGENVGIIDAAFRTRDGRKVYVEGMTNCKMAEGKCQYTRGIFKDVTDRKKAEFELVQKNEDLNAAYEELTATEEELRQNYDELSKKEDVLRESEEKFRTLVELSLDGIIIIDFLGKLLFANQAAGRIFEVADYKAAIGRRNVMDFVAPESRVEVLKDFSKVALGIDAYLVLYQLITEKKRKIWGECIGKKIAFEDSTAILISLRDVTGRKLAEERERESENKFSTVFRSNPVSLTLVSVTDGKFVDANDAFFRSTGYSSDEVIGKMAEDLGFFVDRSEYERFVSALREQRTVEGMEVKCRIKTGEIRTCRFTSGIILMGDRPHLLSSVEDITERKRDLEALRQANKKLNMLSGITRHDIQNQLMTLTGFVALLRKKIPDPSYKDYFSRITATSNAITNIIQFTKEYEKIGVHAPAWQDIRVLVDKTGNDVARDQVMFKNDLPAGMEVFADPLIAKVFYNLMDNAVRHGGKITTVRFSCEEREGDLTMVCEDDGHGVRADEKERIFDRGFGKNTGFGLAISREILDITGITIRETGTPGHGARFWITVPRGAYRFTHIDKKE